MKQVYADNQADKVSKGRGLKGDKHPNAKLTWEQVREIRRRLAEGEPRHVVAEAFGVSYGCIRGIQQHRSWSE